MSCPKNIKTSFMGLYKYHGTHRIKSHIRYVFHTNSMRKSLWKIVHTCENCGQITKIEHHSYEGMLKLGFDKELLNNTKISIK
jgi:hypothetical protein